MIYKGNICDGCGRVFDENDDVVVCPECATPQHRECYNKNNCCVNEHLHAENFEWKGAVTRPKPIFGLEKKQEETSPCPNCGHKNPKGTQKCQSCGMKLVVFGIDLADSIEQQSREKEEQLNAADTSENTNEENYYKPPFELGTGEGFDSQEEDASAQAAEPSSEEPSSQQELENQQPPTAQQISQNIVQGYAQSAQGFVNSGYVDGININLIAALVGPNAYKYIEKFKSLELGKKHSFNWAAFFLSPYWFFYRKLYKAGIIVMTISLMLSVAFTPIMTKASEDYMEKFSQAVPFESVEEFENYFYSMTEEEMTEFSFKLIEMSKPLFTVMAASVLLNVLLGVVCALIADKLYKKETLTKAKAVMNAKTKNEASLLVSQLGGVSAITVLIAFLAEQIIGSVASQLMFY